MGFTTNTKFVLLKLRQRNFWSIHIQISTNLKKFVFNQFYTFHPPPICVHFIDAEKHMRGLMSNFVHFIHPYMNPLPQHLAENDGPSFSEPAVQFLTAEKERMALVCRLRDQEDVLEEDEANPINRSVSK